VLKDIEGFSDLVVIDHEKQDRKSSLIFYIFKEARGFFPSLHVATLMLFNSLSRQDR